MNASRPTIDCPHGRRPPDGYSMLEVMVAMVILGVALGGLFPLAIQYSKQVSSLEACNPQTGRWRYAGGTWNYQDDVKYPNWYLNPPTDVWAKKLGAAAVLSNGIFTGPPDPTPVYEAATRIVMSDNLSGTAFYGETDPANWGDVAPLGYSNSCHRHGSGTDGPASGEYAAWILDNVPPGWYVLEAIWPDPTAGWIPQKEGEPEAATTSACFAVYDSAFSVLLNNAYVGGVRSSQAKAVVNQRDVSGAWQPVMTVFVPSHRLDTGTSTTTVQVRLMSEAQSLAGIATAGFTTADAVRLVPNFNATTLTALVPTFGTTTITAAASVTPLSPIP
jgi:prepilin-type N-terminal cleavage/methylation domain-containing protein